LVIKKKKQLLISFIAFASLFIVTIVGGAQLTTIAPGTSSEINYTFGAYGTNTSTYFSIARTANCTSATANITGFQNEATAAYDNWGFNVSDQDSNPVGLDYNGTYFWVLGSTTKMVYRYYSNGTYSNWNFSVAGEVTMAYDLGYNETYFFVMDAHFPTGSHIRTYYPNGTYFGWDTAMYGISPQGLNYNDSYFWSVGPVSDKVYRYKPGGSTDWNFSVSDQAGGPTDVYYDGTYFLVSDTNSNKVYRYYSNGTYSNWNFSTIDKITSPMSIIKSGNNYWILSRDAGGQNDFVYRYTDIFYPSFAQLDISNDGDLEFEQGGACYQEYSNVSTSCGGLNTGIYSFNGVWNNEGNTYDGNLNTFGDKPAGLGVVYMYINYTKPSGASTSSTWQIKDDIGSANLSLLASCFNQDVLQLRVESLQDGDGAQFAKWYCYDGIWNILRNEGSGGGSVYEESMWWDITFEEEYEVSDFWKEIQDYIDNTCTTATCNVPINVTSGSAGIIELSQILIDFKYKPNITAIDDNSTSASPTNVGDQVRFNSTFTDTDYDNASIYACKSNAFSAGCTGGQWCNSGNGTSPQDCYYTAQAGDSMSNNYWIFALDNDSLQSLNNESGAFDTNHRPNAHLINITPIVSYTNDTLNCTYYFNDSLDSDAEGSETKFIWYNDTALIPTGAGQTLTSANFTKNDNITCSVRANDEHGFNDSVYVNSTEARYINNLQSDVTVATADDSTDGSPTNESSNVTYTSTGTDLDADTYELHICTTNAFAAGTCTIATYCSSGVTASGVQSTCQGNTTGNSSEHYDWYSFFWDGNLTTSAGDGQYSVNHRPNATNLNITPLTSYTNSTLTCNYFFNDTDTASSASKDDFEWYNDTAKIPTGAGSTLTSANFSKSDNITCRVLTYDDHDFPDNMYRNTTSLYINNLQPDSTVAADDDSYATQPTDEGLNVTYNGTATDLDADTYELHICTTDIFATGSCSASTICSSGATASGVQATCQGNTTGNTSQSYNWWGFYWDGNLTTNTTNDIYYVNHRPNAHTINITPVTSYFNSTLTCNYAFNDSDDGDTENSPPTYEWYIQNEGAGVFVDQNSNTSTLAAGFDVADVVRCQVRVRDEHSFQDNVFVNTTADKTISNYAPIIFSNVTVPDPAQLLNSTYISANVSDYDGTMDWVNFTVSYPNGTKYINNVNATNMANGIWNSTSFTVIEYGTWTVNITGTDNDGTWVSTEWTFDVSLGELSFSPMSKSYSQQASASEFTNISISHNGTTFNNISIGTAGNLSNTTAFTVSISENPTNISVGITKYLNVTIKSNNTLANGEYTGALVVNRTNDLNITYLNFTITIATLTGEISLDPITRTDNLNEGDSLSWQLEVSNIGNQDLEHCNLTATAGISGFTTFGGNDFTVDNVTPVNVAVQYTAPGVGANTGTIDVECTSTTGGAVDQEAVDPVNVNVAGTAPPPTGGGGGGTQPTKTDCDIVVPSVIIISRGEPVERVSIINNEEESITPILSLQNIAGKTSGKDLLGVSIEQPIILPGASTDALINLKTSLYVGNDTRYAQLLVSTSDCLEEIVEIEIRPTERKTTFDILTDAKNAIVGYFPFLTEEVFNVYGVSITWAYLISAIAIVTGIIIFAITKRALWSFGGTTALTIILMLAIKYGGGV